jgi:hypothetical protein
MAKRPTTDTTPVREYARTIVSKKGTARPPTVIPKVAPATPQQEKPLQLGGMRTITGLTKDVQPELKFDTPSLSYGRKMYLDPALFTVTGKVTPVQLYVDEKGILSPDKTTVPAVWNKYWEIVGAKKTPELSAEFPSIDVAHLHSGDDLYWDLDKNQYTNDPSPKNLKLYMRQLAENEKPPKYAFQRYTMEDTGESATYDPQIAVQIEEINKVIRDAQEYKRVANLTPEQLAFQYTGKNVPSYFNVADYYDIFKVAEAAHDMGTGKGTMPDQYKEIFYVGNAPGGQPSVTITGGKSDSLATFFNAGAKLAQGMIGAERQLTQQIPLEGLGLGEAKGKEYLYVNGFPIEKSEALGSRDRAVNLFAALPGAVKQLWNTGISYVRLWTGSGMIGNRILSEDIKHVNTDWSPMQKLEDEAKANSQELGREFDYIFTDNNIGAHNRDTYGVLKTDNDAIRLLGQAATLHNNAYTSYAETLDLEGSKKQLIEAYKMESYAYSKLKGSDPFYAHTWAAQPEKYEAYLSAVADVEMQKKAPLNREELYSLQNYYTDPGTEMLGQTVYDFWNVLQVIPAGWVFKGASAAISKSRLLSRALKSAALGTEDAIKVASILGKTTDSTDEAVTFINQISKLDSEQAFKLFAVALKQPFLSTTMDVANIVPFNFDFLGTMRKNVYGKMSRGLSPGIWDVAAGQILNLSFGLPLKALNTVTKGGIKWLTNTSLYNNLLGASYTTTGNRLSNAIDEVTYSVWTAQKAPSLEGSVELMKQVGSVATQLTEVGYKGAGESFFDIATRAGQDVTKLQERMDKLYQQYPNLNKRMIRLAAAIESELKLGAKGWEKVLRDAFDNRLGNEIASVKIAAEGLSPDELARMQKNQAWIRVFDRPRKLSNAVGNEVREIYLSDKYVDNEKTILKDTISGWLIKSSGNNKGVRDVIQGVTRAYNVVFRDWVTAVLARYPQWVINNTIENSLRMVLDGGFKLDNFVWLFKSIDPEFLKHVPLDISANFIDIGAKSEKIKVVDADLLNKGLFSVFHHFKRNVPGVWKEFTSSYSTMSWPARIVKSVWGTAGLGIPMRILTRTISDTNQVVESAARVRLFMKYFASNVSRVEQKTLMNLMDRFGILLSDKLSKAHPDWMAEQIGEVVAKYAKWMESAWVMSAKTPTKLKQLANLSELAKGGGLASFWIPSAMYETLANTTDGYMLDGILSELSGFMKQAVTPTAKQAREFFGYLRTSIAAQVEKYKTSGWDKMFDVGTPQATSKFEELVREAGDLVDDATDKANWNNELKERFEDFGINTENKTIKEALKELETIKNRADGTELSPDEIKTFEAAKDIDELNAGVADRSATGKAQKLANAKIEDALAEIQKRPDEPANLAVMGFVTRTRTKVDHIQAQLGEFFREVFPGALRLGGEARSTAWDKYFAFVDRFMYPAGEEVFTDLHTLLVGGKAPAVLTLSDFLKKVGIVVEVDTKGIVTLEFPNPFGLMKGEHTLFSREDGIEVIKEFSRIFDIKSADDLTKPLVDNYDAETWKLAMTSFTPARPPTEWGQMRAMMKKVRVTDDTEAIKFLAARFGYSFWRGGEIEKVFLVGKGKDEQFIFKRASALIKKWLPEEKDNDVTPRRVYDALSNWYYNTQNIVIAGTDLTAEQVKIRLRNFMTSNIDLLKGLGDPRSDPKHVADMVINILDDVAQTWKANGNDPASFWKQSVGQLVYGGDVKGLRGSISSINKIIKVYKEADVTTVLHEYFHAMMYQNDLKAWIPAKHMKALDTWSESLAKSRLGEGATIENLEREKREIMAQGWEMYIMKNYQPESVEATGAFALLKQIMLKIYEQCRRAFYDIGEELPEKVRRAFDFMVSKEKAASRISKRANTGKIEELFQRTPPDAQWYYSQLGKVLESMQSKMSVDQLRGWLKGKVKEDEIRWTGLEEFLADKKSVTKDEMLNWITENQVVVTESTGTKAYLPYKLAGGNEYKELLLTLPFNLTGEYRSPHWTIPNVLAHIRFDERIDTEGKKTLFIEEIQSDWHQTGREKGYQDVIYHMTNEEYGELLKLQNKRQDRTLEDERRLEKLWELYINTTKQKNIEAVPSVPFAKNWEELTLKRAIAWAVDNGYERVAWTTGEMQAERYDLSRQIRGMEVGKDEAGKYWIDVLDNKNEHYHTIKSDLSELQLPEYIGKEMTQKVLNGEGIKVTEPFPAQRFEGLDLKVGGAGMKAFYDEKLKNVANKYLKRWGIETGETTITDGIGIMKAGGEVEKESFRVPAFDITPAMKQDITANKQPLFQTAEAIGKENWRAGNISDANEFWASYINDPYSGTGRIPLIELGRMLFGADTKLDLKNPAQFLQALAIKVEEIRLTGDVPRTEALQSMYDQADYVMDYFDAMVLHNGIGRILPPPIPLWKLDEPVQRWISLNRYDAAKFSSLVKSLETMEDHVVKALDDRDFNQIFDAPAEVISASKAWANEASQKMSEMLSAATYGGSFAEEVLENAVGRTNKIMIDYTGRSRLDQIARNIFPFWMFPSRSLTYWGEQLLRHPEYGAFYNKYVRFSKSRAYEEGATTTTGEQLPSLRGYVPIPGTSIWVNLMSPTVFRYLLPQINDQYRDEQEGESNILQSVIATIYSESQLRGFGMSPVWYYLLSGIGFEGNYPRPSITAELTNIYVPIFLLPPFAERLILEKMRTFLPTMSIRDRWTAEIPWKDSMIEREMMLHALEQIQANDGRKDVQLSIAKRVDAILASTEREKFPEWLEARARYEQDDYVKRMVSRVSGFYPKEFDATYAELLKLRNEGNRLRESINNELNAQIFDIEGTPESRYQKLLDLKYQTPEYWFWNSYNKIRWVTDPTTGSQLQGEERRNEISRLYNMDAQTDAYYDALQDVSDRRDAELASVPLGAPSKVLSEIWDTWSKERSAIEASPLYADARKAWMSGLKPNSKIEEYFTNMWWQMIAESRPKLAENERYSDFQARVMLWEKSIPFIAKSILPQFQLQLLSSSSDFYEDIYGNDYQSVQGLPEKLLANSTLDTYKARDKERDTLFDALSKAWDETYANYYYPIYDLSGQQRLAYELKFKKNFPTPPEAMELFQWVDKEYPGRWKLEDVEKALTDKPTLTIDESQVYDKDQNIETMKDEIWDVLSWGYFGADRDKIRSKLKELGVKESYLDTWYNSGGSDTAFGAEENFTLFHDKLMLAAYELDIKEPTEEQVAERIEAENLNTTYYAQIEEIFGTDVQQYRDAYFSMSYDEKRTWRKANKDLYNLYIKDYSEFRKKFSKDNPIWAKYFNPDEFTEGAVSTSKATVASGGAYSGSTSSGGGYSGRGSYQRKKYSTYYTQRDSYNDLANFLPIGLRSVINSLWLLTPGKMGSRGIAAKRITKQ